jgi:hypothetical protein
MARYSTLELLGYIGQAQERFGGGADVCSEEVAVVERIVATGTDHEVRRVRR